jgi:hypothetical protein
MGRGRARGVVMKRMVSFCEGANMREEGMYKAAEVSATLIRQATEIKL